MSESRPSINDFKTKIKTGFGLKNIMLKRILASINSKLFGVILSFCWRRTLTPLSLTVPGFEPTAASALLFHLCSL